MTTASAPAPFKHPDRFFIGGEWVAPSSSAKIDVINSGTEELFVQVAEAQVADVDRAVASAREAFDNGPWTRMTPAERAPYLRAIGQQFRDRAGEIGNSRWRLNASATWNHGPLMLYLQGRYLQSALIDVTYGPADISDNSVPSRIYLNGTAQYTLKQAGNGQLQAFLNVNNLLDKAPPVVPSASASPSQAPLAPDYDKIGRYFNLGLRFKY